MKSGDLKNLLEGTDELPRRGGAIHPCRLDAAVCCSSFLLMRALLMTSSHSKAGDDAAPQRLNDLWQLSFQVALKSKF